MLLLNMSIQASLYPVSWSSAEHFLDMVAKSTVYTLIPVLLLSMVSCLYPHIFDMLLFVHLECSLV